MTITFLLYILACLAAAYVFFQSFKDLDGSADHLNRLTMIISKGAYADITSLSNGFLTAVGVTVGGIIFGFFYDTLATIALLIAVGFLSTKKNDITFNRNEVFVLNLLLLAYFAVCILT